MIKAHCITASSSDDFNKDIEKVLTDKNISSINLVDIKFSASSTSMGGRQVNALIIWKDCADEN